MKENILIHFQGEWFDFVKHFDTFSRGMVCILLRSFFGQMNFSRIKTRIKIIQKVIRVFQYPHCVEATT
jgi:hypothetical protein